MSKSNLAGKALHIIYRYWKSHNHEYPASIEISSWLDVTPQNWGNLRKRMIDNKLLKPSKAWGIELTDLGFSEVIENSVKEKADSSPDIKTGGNLADISTNPPATLNYVEIVLFGAVKAGLGSREDDLAIYTGEETYSVPAQIGDPSKCYAMRVEGESMIHEGIFPGDIVIAEKVSLPELNDGDLVIAKYLPNKYSNKKRAEIQNAVDAGDLQGPTLKYYKRLTRGDGRLSYRLSWQTESEESDFKIDTPYIENNEIGRVIAVYSPEQFRLIRPVKKQ